jgi:hypothetical protein
MIAQQHQDSGLAVSCITGGGFEEIIALYPPAICKSMKASEMLKEQFVID